MATQPAPPADDLFPAAETCPRCEQLACDCPKPAGLLGALAEVPQPAEPPASPPGVDFALVAQIYGSGSVGAFLSVRVDQAIRHGHTPAKDRELPPFWLVREAKERLGAILDSDIGRDQGAPARNRQHRERRRRALRRLEKAGALLMAAHDHLAAIVAADAGLTLLEEEE